MDRILSDLLALLLALRAVLAACSAPSGSLQGLGRLGGLGLGPSLGKDGHALGGPGSGRSRLQRRGGRSSPLRAHTDLAHSVLVVHRLSVHAPSAETHPIRRAQVGLRSWDEEHVAVGGVG